MQTLRVLLYLHSYRAYSSQVVPLLVFSCEESTLNVMCESLDCTPTALLKSCLPSCMVLILTCWAQEQDGEIGEDLRKKAMDSHKLLCKHMSEEVSTSWSDQKVQWLLFHYVYQSVAILIIGSWPDPAALHWSVCDWASSENIWASQVQDSPVSVLSHLWPWALLPTLYFSCDQGHLWLHAYLLRICFSRHYFPQAAFQEKCEDLYINTALLTNSPCM